MILLPSLKDVEGAQKATGQMIGDRNAMDVVAHGVNAINHYQFNFAFTSSTELNASNADTLPVTLSDGNEAERVVYIHVAVNGVTLPMVIGIGGSGGFLSNRFVRIPLIGNKDGDLNAVYTHMNWVLRNTNNNTRTLRLAIFGSGGISAGRVIGTIGTVPV